MKFKTGDLVKNAEGGVIEVGGYDEQSFAWHPKEFYEEGNEERGWFNEDDFELVKPE